MYIDDEGESAKKNQNFNLFGWRRSVSAGWESSSNILSAGINTGMRTMAVYCVYSLITTGSMPTIPVYAY